MSVINQMLKDLEQRRQQGVQQGNVLDGLSWQAERRRGSLMPALLLVIVLVVAVSAWFAYQYGATRQLTNDAVPADTAQTGVVTTPPVTTTSSDVLPSPPRTEVPAAAGASTPAPAPEATAGQPVRSQPGQVAAAADTPEPVTVLPRIDRLRPSPVPATGKPITISLHGKGFIAPLRVIVSRDEGSDEQELHAEQVSVVSDKRFSMTLDPGTQTENWQVRVINDHGEVSNHYSFMTQAARTQGTPAAAATAVVKTVRQRSPAEQAQERMRQASSLLTQGDARGGEQALREALLHDPDLHAARELLAGVLLQQGRKNEAGEVLDAGLSRPVVPASVILLRARVYAEQQHEAEAISILESKRPPLGEAVDYYALLAALYQRQARHADAANLYRQLLQLRPRQAVWQMGMGISLEAIGQHAEAITAYETALNSGLQDELHAYVSQRLRALK
ncbi:MAG: tetratricopeptide repeat protein [Granulosicoccaceae bacterium]